VPPEPADLIDAVTGQSLGLLSLPPPQRAVAVAPDRRTVAVLGPGQKLGLWDLPQQQIRHELWWPETATAKEPGPTDEAQLVRFSPDGRLLAWACGGAAAHVGFWDPATGEHQGSLEDLQGGVTALAFSADAQTLAVGQISGPAHSESQGRKGALTISISLWDVASGTQCTELKGHRGPIYALAFSPDGRTLASGSRDTTVRLWETRSGLELAALTGHAGTVFGVAFAPQGGLLATGAGDHTCCSWRATPERAVQEREAAQRVAELRGTLVLRSEILKQLGQDATLSEGVRREALRLASTLPDDVRRQAQHLVAQLSDRIPLKTEMLEAIRQQPQLAAGVREEALGLAHDLDDDPDRLNDASWRIAMAPQQTAAHYAAAERLMRIACSLRPDDWKLLNTLAVLLYRRGEFAQALATLRRSAELSTQAFGEPHPADVAFMAMTQFRLGEREAAQSNLQTLEKVAEQREWQNNDLLQLLLREATQVLHSAAEESCKPAP
jgi:Flp pilus assembly protein TadD